MGMTQEARSTQGRPVTTNAKQIAVTALELFTSAGFDKTTMNDVAEAAGVSRRTAFRYFASKNDLVWGGFEEALERLHKVLSVEADDGRPADETTWARIEHAQLVSLEAAPQWLHVTRLRLRLIAQEPNLIAHGSPKLAGTQREIAEFLVRRGIGPDVSNARVQIVSAAAVAAFFRALISWAESDDADPESTVRLASEALSLGFATL
jgi:AcrR family transcriptional regulator